MNTMLELIERFPLLSRLGEEQRHQMARDASVVCVEEGQVLCTEGSQAPRLLFLVSGDALLAPRSGTPHVVRAGSARATMPLADDKPAPFTITTRTSCTVLEVGVRGLRSSFAAPPPTSGYELEEIEIDNGRAWLDLLLRTKAFRRIPAPNIQAFIHSSTEITVRAGEYVVRQGEPATSFYLIKAGRFRVIRQEAASNEETELALLNEGSTFGEDALISHGRRGASVIALDEGTVIRLSKQDFTNLVVNPVLQPISPQEAMSRSAQGAALIDVRSPDHHRNNGLPASINIPMAELRSYARSLDRRREWVVYCDNGNLSAAAAYVLGEYGFRTYLLAGGLNSFARRPAAMAGA